ncbi:MAG: hypothetical protein GX187_08710 [Clostridiaceae bacterium]|nr:hypothetical protein [Clostridiaceae bacterium]
MEGFLRLGFFSMAEKVTKALGGSLPYIITGAVIVGIWVYFLFLVPRKSKRYDNFLDYLSDVLNFRVMIGSALAKILYIAFALTLIIIGLVAMVAANFLVGLIGTIILQIVLRALFEVVMVFFSIQENVVFLREKKEEDSKDLYYGYEEEEM